MYFININKYTFITGVNKDYWTAKPTDPIVMLSS